MPSFVTWSRLLIWMSLAIPYSDGIFVLATPEEVCGLEHRSCKYPSRLWFWILHKYRCMIEVQYIDKWREQCILKLKISFASLCSCSSFLLSVGYQGFTIWLQFWTSGAHVAHCSHLLNEFVITEWIHPYGCVCFSSTYWPRNWIQAMNMNLAAIVAVTGARWFWAVHSTATRRFLTSPSFSTKKGAISSINQPPFNDGSQVW